MPFNLDDDPFFQQYAGPAAPPQVPAYRRGGVVVQRGTSPATVYVPRQPRVGVPGPAAGGDPYDAMLAEAQRPFSVAGGGEYDLGGLDYQAWLHDNNQRLRTAPVVAQRDQRDFQQGQVKADQTRADAAMLDAKTAMSPLALALKRAQVEPDYATSKQYYDDTGFTPADPNRRISLAVPPETPGGTHASGDAVLKALPAPLPEGDPTRGDILEQHRPELEKAAAGGVVGDLFDLIPQALNGLVRVAGGPDLRTGRQAKKERARKFLGMRRPARVNTVGIPPASALPPAEMSYLIGR